MEPTAEILGAEAKADPEKLPDPMVQKRKSSPKRVEANRKNGRLGGLGRRKPAKYSDVQRLKRAGYSVEQIADRLGVSRWTVRRRVVEEQRENAGF